MKRHFKQTLKLPAANAEGTDLMANVIKLLTVNPEAENPTAACFITPQPTKDKNASERG